MFAFNLCHIMVDLAMITRIVWHFIWHVHCVYRNAISWFLIGIYVFRYVCKDLCWKSHQNWNLLSNQIPVFTIFTSLHIEKRDRNDENIQAFKRKVISKWCRRIKIETRVKSKKSTHTKTHKQRKAPRSVDEHVA